MLTNRQGAVRRIDLPHEPGAWVEVRPISWRQLREAIDEAQTAGIRRLATMAGEFHELRELMAEARATTETGRADAYDTATLLRHGVVAWSYTDPVTAETLDELDQETVDLIVAELLPRARGEADRKNGTGPSTGRSKGRERLPTTG